jgi:ABC-type multidrug transport system fused ATPase/permease subunit
MIWWRWVESRNYIWVSSLDFTGSADSIAKTCAVYKNGHISSLDHMSLSPRSQLAVIPQEPFLFSGTVRENLDPRGLHEDGALWQALEQCHLNELIVSMGECWALTRRAGKEQGTAICSEDVSLAGGLDRELGEGGRSLSLGQRQLLCLARALLTDAKVRQHLGMCQGRGFREELVVGS